MVLPVADRIDAFSDHARRGQLVADMDGQPEILRHIFVKGVSSEDNRRYVGRFLVEIAETENKSVTDVFLNIALRDDLETEFATENSRHRNLDNLATMLMHPMLQIGGSDGGAHVAQFATNGDCPYILEHFVRTHGYMTLEQAVRRMTSEIARQTGIKDRGVIAKGNFADLVLLDPDTVARGEQEEAFDMPGDRPRFVRHPTGIDTVIVNGRVVRRQGAYTDARPGMIV